MIESAEFLENGSINTVYSGTVYTVPDVESNRFRKILAEWEAEGNTIAPYLQDLDNLKSEVRGAIKQEYIKRLGDIINIIPELDFTDSATLLYRHGWPIANASAELTQGKANYDFALTRFQMVAGASREQLESYDASGDNWP